MQLSEHFSYAEMTRTDHREFDNTPNDKELINLVRLSNFLEDLRHVLGNKPIIITSAYRSKQVNDSVGSKETSQHRLGCAADFRVPGMTPHEVVSIVVDSNLEFDQVICELTWTHVSIPNTALLTPRRQALVIDKNGTRLFVKKENE